MRRRAEGCRRRAGGEGGGAAVIEATAFPVGRTRGVGRPDCNHRSRALRHGECGEAERGSTASRCDRGRRDPAHHAACDHRLSVELDDLWTASWHRSDLHRNHFSYQCPATEIGESKALTTASRVLAVRIVST